ncbi:MAG: hypothetical protein WA997_17570, partial [Anaerolineales bacterium]
INPSRLTKQVADLYFSELYPVLENDSVKSEVEVSKLSARELESKLGIYFCSKTGSVCDLSMKEGKLISEVFGLNFQIVSTSQNQFKAIDIPYDISFTFEPAESATKAPFTITVP